MSVRLIDGALLAEVTAEAQASPRLRKNRNFHPRDDYPGHRLLNALEPGSYVPPHRHLNPNKDETMVVLGGRLGLVTFDGQGTITGTAVLAPWVPAKGQTDAIAYQATLARLFAAPAA